MFGNKKKGNGELNLTPKDLQQLSQDNLYLLFLDEQWQAMNPTTQLAVLQEAENRRAAADGRQPVKVRIGNKKQFSHPGSLGYYLDETKEIHLNYRYFSGKSPMHSGAGALCVLLHEGRHAYQYFRVNSGVSSNSAALVKEWLSSTTFYFNPDAMGMALYGLQSIEDDARRFSRRELQRIINNMMIRGINCQGFLTEYQNTLQQEAQFIMMVRENLTIDDMYELESLVIQDMKKVFPKLNIEDMALFENAKLILEAEIESFDDLTLLLDQLDKLADEKLNKIQSKRLNQIHNRF